MAFLNITNVVKRFGDHAANDHLSMSVEKGRIFGLLGPNGAGKTTLIRMITNIIMPDEGELLLDGLPVDAVQQNLIGYLPEERGLYKKLKVADQMTYFGQLKGLTSAEAMKRGLWWLHRMDANGWETRKVQELSKGMQQKVQFITTILHEPSLLILDEPFSGLDPVNADLLISVIKELQSRGTTVILSTHQMDQVEKLCDDIVLINKGKVVLGGSVRAVKAEHRSNRVHLEYHGDDAAVRTIPGTSVGSSSIGRVELILDEGTLPNAVLHQSLQHVEVTKFEVAEPSLHDIFVAAVTTTSTQ
jgi:ABC-2 type transport system ATP-binding protein